MARMKLPPKSVTPMAQSTMPAAMPASQPAGLMGKAPVAAPAAMPAPAVAPVAKPAPSALQQKTHNPANLLPAGAFHGKRR